MEKVSALVSHVVSQEGGIVLLGMAVPREVQTVSALHESSRGAWGNLLCCEKLSGAGGVRGQLEVSQEFKQMKASLLLTVALPFSLPAEYTCASLGLSHQEYRKKNCYLL